MSLGQGAKAAGPTVTDSGRGERDFSVTAQTTQQLTNACLGSVLQSDSRNMFQEKIFTQSFEIKPPNPSIIKLL